MEGSWMEQGGFLYGGSTWDCNVGETEGIDRQRIWGSLRKTNHSTATRITRSRGWKEEEKSRQFLLLITFFFGVFEWQDSSLSGQCWVPPQHFRASGQNDSARGIRNRRENQGNSTPLANHHWGNGMPRTIVQWRRVMVPQGTVVYPCTRP